MSQVCVSIVCGMNNMKVVICFTVFVAFAAGDRIISESNGPYHVLLHTNFKRCFHGKNLNLEPGLIRIKFSDYANDVMASFPINDAAQGILNLPGLNKTNKFVVFVPGYTSKVTAKTRQLIKDSFKEQGTYVITLQDWFYTNPFPNPMTGYQRSVLYVDHIGKALAEMLITLSENGVSPKDIHIIGHSLGSHIVGTTGKAFYEKTGVKIARITGLDPAGPCYYDSQNQLNSDAADFVDIYHCNAYQLGTDKDLGDVNFYVNDGVSQPRCGSPTIPDISLSSAASLCSHMACQNFYFLTVRQPNLFPAYKCGSYEDFKNGACGSDQTIAGYWTPENINGVYYTSTAGQSIN